MARLTTCSKHEVAYDTVYQYECPACELQNELDELNDKINKDGYEIMINKDSRGIMYKQAVNGEMCVTVTMQDGGVIHISFGTLIAMDDVVNTGAVTKGDGSK